MSTTARGMVSALAVLALALIYLSWAYSYPSPARDLPVLVGWVLLALALLDIAAHTPSRVGRYLRQLLSGQALDADRDAGAGAPPPLRRHLGAMAWPVGFVGAVWLVGFLAASALFVFAFMTVQGRARPLAALLAASVITGVIWLGFEIGMRYETFRGVLFGG